MLALFLHTILVVCVFAIPSPPLFFDEQLVTHFSPYSERWSQRYYQNSTNFKGPGSPIIVIMGGEGQITPTTGIFYPPMVLLAARIGALIIEVCA